jgi:hypothetical protein
MSDNLNLRLPTDSYSHLPWRVRISHSNLSPNQCVLTNGNTKNKKLIGIGIEISKTSVVEC